MDERLNDQAGYKPDEEEYRSWALSTTKDDRDFGNKTESAQTQVTIASPFQMTSRLICRNQANIDEPNTTTRAGLIDRVVQHDFQERLHTAHREAPARPPTPARFRRGLHAAEQRHARISFRPTKRSTRAETRKAIRSGRNPLPMPKRHGSPHGKLLLAIPAAPAAIRRQQRKQRQVRTKWTIETRMPENRIH